MKNIVRYGILDFDGEVIRWVECEPDESYDFITVKVKREPKPKIDLSGIEDAPL